MEKFNNYPNTQFSDHYEDALMNIVGFSGMTLLIVAAVLNMAGVLGGVSFFAVFVLSFTLLIGGIGLLVDKTDKERKIQNSDPDSV